MVPYGLFLSVAVLNFIEDITICPSCDATLGLSQRKRSNESTSQPASVSGTKRGNQCLTSNPYKSIASAGSTAGGGGSSIATEGAVSQQRPSPPKATCQKKQKKDSGEVRMSWEACEKFLCQFISHFKNADTMRLPFKRHQIFISILWNSDEGWKQQGG